MERRSKNVAGATRGWRTSPNTNDGTLKKIRADDTRRQRTLAMKGLVNIPDEKQQDANCDHGRGDRGSHPPERRCARESLRQRQCAPSAS